MNTEISLLITPILCAAGIVFWTVGLILFSRYRKKMKDMQQRSIVAGLTDEQKEELQKQNRSLSSLKYRYTQSDYGRKLQRDLIQARVRFNNEPISSYDFFVVTVLFSVILFFILSRLLRVDTIFAIPLTFASFHYIPKMFIRYRRNRFIEQFDKQLADVTTNLASAIRAGFSIPQAIKHTAERVPQPSQEEFVRVHQEITYLGSPLDAAFANLLERVPSENLVIIVTMIQIQKRTGGDLVKALTNLSEIMRTRLNSKKEIGAALASTKATGRIVAILPVGTLILVNYIFPGSIEVLFESWIGFALLAASGTLLLIGVGLMEFLSRRAAGV